MSKALRGRKSTTRRSRKGDAASSLGDVLEFMRVIWQLDHALQRTSKRMEASLGVTGPQRLVIRIVGRYPDIPAGELAKWLHVHPSTLTGVLKRLERQQILRRRTDPADARRSLLRLTDKGRTFDVEEDGTVEACIAHTLRRTPSGKLDAACELLAAITKQLGDTLQEPAAAPAPRRRAR
ncbi:MAG: MarR family transcriptional regulator [Polyangiales bacterium]